MKLKMLKGDFTICKLKNIDQVDFSNGFCFIGKTDEEISLICSTEYVPQNTIERNDKWNGFRVQETLDFSLIGIISKITSILADNEIPVITVSTYNTDYIFIKADNLERSTEILKKKNYSFIQF